MGSHIASANDDTVSDPSTREGQKVGVVLVVKSYIIEETEHDHRQPILRFAVGDHLKILGFLDCFVANAKNLRTEETGFMDWASFFPLKIAQECGCGSGFCRCVLESPRDYWAYELASRGKGAFSNSAEPTIIP